MSSSAHLVLVPELLGWAYREVAPEERKSFEVALHAATGLALALALRGELWAIDARAGRRELSGLALALGPPALAGLTLERPVERLLSRPRAVAAAQLAGGVGLAIADRAPATRGVGDAGALDHALIGVAQALALVPGISRGGATLTAARALRFERRAAARLSRRAALPVMLAAVALKGFRASRGALPRELAAPFAVGAGAAFGSALAARGLVTTLERASSYLPFAIYRAALGLLVLLPIRLRD